MIRDTRDDLRGFARQPIFQLAEHDRASNRHHKLFGTQAASNVVEYGAKFMRLYA
ncbi:hypothetical protein D3C84_1284260 [compost metagenome]